MKPLSAKKEQFRRLLGHYLSGSCIICFSVVPIPRHILMLLVPSISDLEISGECECCGGLVLWRMASAQDMMVRETPLHVVAGEY